MKKITIAIDGHSSCGKSTIAKELSAILGFRYVDSGAMYRAVTLFFLRNQIEFRHLNLVQESLKDISIAFKMNLENKRQEIFLNGENVEIEIRVNPRVASAVSDVSAISEVRKFLVKQQQKMGEEGGIVMDGRDIGTVVFPQAEIKIFVTADAKIRAQRRFDELKSKGQETTFEEVLANLEKRDSIDSTRDDSPLIKSKDAIELDTTNLSREQQLEFVLKLLNEKNAMMS